MLLAAYAAALLAVQDQPATDRQEARVSEVDQVSAPDLLLGAQRPASALNAATPPPNSLFLPQVGAEELDENETQTDVEIDENGADLVIAALQTPDFADPGDVFNVSVTIANEGLRAAPAGSLSQPSYDIRLAISTDQSVSLRNLRLNVGNDVTLVNGSMVQTPEILPAGIDAQSNTPQGTRQTLSFMNVGTPPGTPPGLYFICAAVDVANAVPEQDESNNTRCTPFFLRPGPEQL